MQRIEKILDQQKLKSVCDILGHTSLGLTKTQLSELLIQSGIQIISDGCVKTEYGIKPGLNKREWLYNCLATEINKNRTLDKTYEFIQKALNPARYTNIDSRDQYNYLLTETNKILLLAGLSVSKEGKLEEVTEAKTLDEVDRRVDILSQSLYHRSIHNEVRKYCIKDYLREDYYDAVFEAAKGLAERVRQLSGLSTDGGTLFQTAFSKNDPYIIFNALTSESDISEHIGLKELLEAIFHLVRNPAAHTPKVNWKTDVNKALDILTVISFAHKFLDECHRFPGK